MTSEIEDAVARVTPEVREILDQHMSAPVMAALDRGKGVVVYPENFNRILSALAASQAEVERLTREGGEAQAAQNTEAGNV